MTAVGACSRDIPGIHVVSPTADLPPLDAPSVHFAAEAMLARLEELRRHVPSLADPADDEPVHQTRVASRRLRAAFALFDGVLPSETLHRWDRRVRRLAKALGKARDFDVQTSFLDQFMAELDLKASRPGLDRLRLRLAQRRRRAQRDLRRTLRRFERRRTTEEIDQELRETAVRAKLAEGSGAPEWLRVVAASRIMSFVEQVLIHEPFVEQADRVEELHQMRIAAKHLRYALEIVAPLFEGRLAAPVEVSRSLQRQLGEIHDCDVWIDFLPRFIRGERRRTRKFFGHTRGFRRISQGLEELLASRRAHRAELHDAFVDYWHRSCGGQFWLDLRTVLADGPSGGAGVPSPSGRDRAPTAG